MPRLWDASGVPRVSGTYVFFDAVWGERIVKGEQASGLTSVPRGKTRRRCWLPRLRCSWTSSGQRGFVGQRDGQTQDDRKGAFPPAANAWPRAFDVIQRPIHRRKDLSSLLSHGRSPSAGSPSGSAANAEMRTAK